MFSTSARLIPAIFCIFDVQIQILITFEGINIFQFSKKGIKVLFSSFNFFFETLCRSFMG